MATARSRRRPARGQVPRAATRGDAAAGRPCADVNVSMAAVGGAGLRVYRLRWSSNCLWLACTERDDASNRIVRRDANRDPVAWNHFDAEAAHAAAQLGQHFVTGVTLHAVEPAAVNRHDRALHIDQIVLAQSASNPFPSIHYFDTENCGILIW